MIKNPDNVMVIKFVASKLVNGEIKIEIKGEDIESEVKFWESPLTMYVLGGELSMNMVKQYMMKSWNFVQFPCMFYYDEG